MITLNFDTVLMERKLTALSNVVPGLMPGAYQYFRNETPVKTGNARSNTTLVGNVIYANYPYAAVLDAGRGYRNGQMRGSEQAPYGMSAPTINLVMKQLAVAMAQAIMSIKG